jgi:DNA-binding NtrC family response regulator
MEIVAPPLRNRSEDIPVLIEWFLQKIADSEEGRIKRVVPEAIDLLMKYSFPGNVRELRNIVAGAYYSTVGDKIGLNEMPPEVRQDYSKPIHSEIHAAGRLYRDILEGKGTFEALIKEPFLKHQFGSALVREIIQKALQDSGGKYKAAFSRLRIPDRRYMHTMQFLKRNECYIDFHPFRKI